MIQRHCWWTSTVIPGILKIYSSKKRAGSNFLRFYSYSSCRFTEKLRGNYRDYPCTCYPYTGLAPPLSISPQEGTFVCIIDELSLTCLQPKSRVYSNIHSWSCSFHGSRQMYTNAAIFFISEYFHCPKSSVFLLFSPTPHPRKHWSFYSFHCLALD